MDQKSFEELFAKAPSRRKLLSKKQVAAMLKPGEKIDFMTPEYAVILVKPGNRKVPGIIRTISRNMAATKRRLS